MRKRPCGGLNCFLPENSVAEALALTCDDGLRTGALGSYMSLKLILTAGFPALLETTETPLPSPLPCEDSKQRA